MQIDGNPKETEALKRIFAGDTATGNRMQAEFVAEVNASIAAGEDHCSCTADCPYHGNCVECVAIHRAHRNHVPCCFFDMLNERLSVFSDLTEGSFLK